MKKQCPIIVNSDAHDPDYVGRFSEALELLNKVQFPQELILNADIKRLKEFIHK